MTENVSPIKVELDVRGYWNPKDQVFCNEIGKNDDWTWETLLVIPLKNRYKNLELEAIEQTANKILLRVKFNNREATPNAVYSIMNRYLQINKGIIVPSGLSVEREMQSIPAQ